MALTKDYTETVLADLRGDIEFAQAVYRRALRTLIEGERASAFAQLRNIIHARISFPGLAKRTGFNVKSLHRMLGPAGNPTVKNLLKILSVVQEELGIAAVELVGAVG